MSLNSPVTMDQHYETNRPLTNAFSSVTPPRTPNGHVTLSLPHTIAVNSHILNVIDTTRPRANTDSDMDNFTHFNEEREMRSLSPPATSHLTTPVYDHRRCNSLTPEPYTNDLKGLLSPRHRPKMKRRETVDTSTINREDYEVCIHYTINASIYIFIHPFILHESFLILKSYFLVYLLLIHQLSMY